MLRRFGHVWGHAHDTQCSCALHPPCCLNVPRTVLTTLYAITALGLPHGQGGQCGHSCQRATDETDKPRPDASPLEGEHDTEPHPAAVHVLVGVRHAMERIGFDHWVHPGQGTEFQGVL